MIWFQLFLSFLQIGLFSFGGGYAAMPLIQEQIVNIHALSQSGSVYRPDHHFPDDPRPYRHKLRYLCGDTDRRDPGSVGGYSGLYPAFLYYCHSPGKTVSEISETGCTAKCAEFSPPCGCGPDRFCRDLHPGHCFLGQRGSDPAGRYRLAPGGYFYSLCSAFAETEMESHPGHGAGGRYEAGSGGSTEMDILTSF